MTELTSCRCHMTEEEGASMAGASSFLKRGAYNVGRHGPTCGNENSETS
jgi:hypothetical protein